LKTYGELRYRSTIIDLGTRWEWSVSHPSRFTPGERFFGTHWIGLGSPTAGFYAVKKIKKIFPLLGIESMPYCPADWATYLYLRQLIFFLIGIGGWSPIWSTRHCGHQWPIVPAPGDYDGEIGGMIGRGNRSTRRQPAPVPLCPPQTPHATRTTTGPAAVGSQRVTA
jgi:hypothetical protein